MEIQVKEKLDEFFKNRKEIEKIIGYTFCSEHLLRQAFIRRSYATENRLCAMDNELLEFIGDKVLDFLILRRLMRRYGVEHSYVGRIGTERASKEDARRLRYFLCPDKDVGRLTEMKARLVESRMLAAAMDELGLASYLIMNRGDEQNHVEQEPHVKEDLFEAILGAVALDCNWDTEVLDRVVDKMLRPEERLDEGLDENYVGLLQELWQKDNPDSKPPYVVEERGNGYYCTLEVDDAYGDCEAPSRKEAIAEVARTVYLQLKEYESALDLYKSLVGEISEATAINRLQELWQKGYIPEPKYTFYKDTENGMDCWMCECTVDGWGGGQGSYSNKLDAKKAAAYGMLYDLMGYADRYFKTPKEK